MEQAVMMLNVADLRPMENYRKSMDEKKMAELTESVRTKGVVQPILVRPNGKGYEIVFGQRRWMASKRAGLATIPAMVRKVTDAEALELQVIENSQREDPNPMEEGIGFKKLLNLGKHTTETLAAKLDKSADYVLGRIKLTILPKEAQDKMLSGAIAIGHALQLTRLKSEGEMKRLLKEIIEEGMSVKDTERHIRHTSTDMAAALFDTTNCGNCQSRTRNQTVLFPGTAKEKDQCVDRSCFYTKTKAYYETYAAALKSEGMKVLTTEKATDECTRKPTSRRISLEKSDWSGEKPKNPAQCRKCKEDRAFYFFERKLYDGDKRLETGWICLSKSCLDKMNRQPSAKSSGASPSAKPMRNTRQHALAVRDRFIYAAMPAKFEKSRTLQKRLTLFHVLGRFSQLHGSQLPADWPTAEQRRAEILASFLPGRDTEEVSEYGYGDDAYAVIATIAEKDLDREITRAVLTSLRYTDSEVLLRMAPEAGIKFGRDFKIDEPHLNTMTKGELVKFAKTLGIKDLKLDPEAKKPDMILEFLKHDLTGKVPKDVAEECELPDLDELCPKIKPSKGIKRKR